MRNVFIVFLLCILILPGTIVNATGNDLENKNEELEETLNDYFKKLYSALLMDSTRNFSKEEFSSVNGYIIAQKIVSTREMYKELLGGICDVQLDEMILDDVTQKANTLEAIVYVKYTYAYGDASAENQSTVGTLIKATILNKNGAYIVQDLDSNSIEVQMVKDSINTTKAVAAKSLDCVYDAVDSYFEEIQKNTESLKEDVIYAEPVEEEDVVEPLATQVSYDAQTARDYGFRLGDHSENYIFNRASLDCTNFASQCVWAGYGGTSGYQIPWNPSETDSTCEKLKQRVKNDYRMTKKWYGRMYGSKNGNPPSEFCGVVSFYDYVTSNTGKGPKAKAYNNGKVYSNLSTTINKGDVLQFYKSSAKRYYHTVVVVSNTSRKVADYAKVRVAQHQDDYYYRNLEELINYFGGKSCKMRLLRFKSTTF